jgi:negative regulator of flagellin synthesis FlgM
MVDIVKNTSSRVEVRKAGNTAPQDVQASQVKASAKGASQNIKPKSIESQSAVKEMAAAAPIDKENVNRIKDAIKRGEYPIDLDRVSDALMEAYKEMKS